MRVYFVTEVGMARSEGFDTIDADPDSWAPIAGLGIQDVETAGLSGVTWCAPASALSHAVHTDACVVTKTWAEAYMDARDEGLPAMAAENAAIQAVRELNAAWMVSKMEELDGQARMAKSIERALAAILDRLDALETRLGEE